MPDETGEPIEIGDLNNERREIIVSLSEREAFILSSALYGLGDMAQGNLNGAAPKLGIAQAVLSYLMDEENNGRQGVKDYWNLICQIHHPFCRHEGDCKLDPAIPLEFDDEIEIGGYL